MVKKPSYDEELLPVFNGNIAIDHVREVGAWWEHKMHEAGYPLDAIMPPYPRLSWVRPETPTSLHCHEANMTTGPCGWTPRWGLWQEPFGPEQWWQLAGVHKFADGSYPDGRDVVKTWCELNATWPHPAIPALRNQQHMLEEARAYCITSGCGSRHYIVKRKAAQSL